MDAEQRRRRRLWSGLLGIVCLALVLIATPAGASQSGRQDWLQPAVTTVSIYGSLYVVVVIAVQSARHGVAAVAPTAWVDLAQTFGVPLLVVPVMANLVPAVRSAVPRMVAEWFEDRGQSAPEAQAR